MLQYLGYDGSKVVFGGVMIVSLLCNLVCLEDVGYTNDNDNKIRETVELPISE